jgi:hypothetical protein
VNNRKLIWKAATIAVAFLLLANPELIALALFVDVVGLDLFLILIQVQVMALSGYYFQVWIKPILMPVYSYLLKIDPYFFIPSKDAVRQCPVILCHAVPFFMALMLFI